MDKRSYTPPTIVRVKLEHQQAVLAACSTTATTLSTRVITWCSKRSSNNCRKQSSTTGRDSSSTS